VDDVIGPIFTDRIKAENWDAHVSKISDFWSSIFLKTNRFKGNPMSKHIQLIEIEPQHFKRWLMLFEQTAHETLESLEANEIVKMANRIGQSLQMGLAFNYRKQGIIDHPFLCECVTAITHNCANHPPATSHTVASRVTRLVRCPCREGGTAERCNIYTRVHGIGTGCPMLKL